MKLFVTVLAAQEEEISEYCFGNCPEVVVGALWDDELGSLCYCVKDVCPFLDNEAPEPFAEINGASLFLRKLRAASTASDTQNTDAE